MFMGNARGSVLTEGLASSIGALALMVNVAIFPMVALAQQQNPEDGPSIEETVAYINSKLQACHKEQRLNIQGNLATVELPVAIVMWPEDDDQKAFYHTDDLGIQYQVELTGLSTKMPVEKNDNWGPLGDWDIVLPGPTFAFPVRCREASCFKSMEDNLTDGEFSKLLDEVMETASRRLRREGPYRVSYVRNKARLGFWLHFCDEDAATRAQRAFHHLILKSGGRDDEEVELF